MIKNVIFDVGKVLVEWEPLVAMKKLGFDDATAKAVAAATTDSPEWDESDRSVGTDEEILAMLADGRFIPYHRAFIQLLFALRHSRGAHVSKLG